MKGDIVLKDNLTDKFLIYEANNNVKVEMVFVIGFRVKTPEGTKFRIRTNKQLKEINKIS